VTLLEPAVVDAFISLAVGEPWRFGLSQELLDSGSCTWGWVVRRTLISGAVPRTMSFHA